MLRAATFGYLSTNEAGESDVDIDVVRQGRSVVTCHGRVSRDGKVITVARMHFSAPRSGLEFSDAPARGPKPDDTVRLERPSPSHDQARRWTLPPETHLAARMHTFHAHAGLAVEDGTIHLPDGTLLATVRQTRLAG